MIRKKKWLHQMLLQHCTPEMKEEYWKAKREAKQAVCRAKNEEWVKLGERMEKSLLVNQREFWRWIKDSREGSQDMQQTKGQCRRDYNR